MIRFDTITRLICWKAKIIFLKLKYRRSISLKWSDRISNSVIIRINGKGRIIIGDNVEIRENVILNVSCGGTISIGNNVFINDMCCLNSRDKIYIKDDVLFGQGVKVYDHDHDYRSDNFKQNFTHNPVTINEEVWICSNVIILKGCSIGSKSVIAAGTIVRDNVSSNVICYEKKENTQKTIVREIYENERNW